MSCPATMMIAVSTVLPYIRQNGSLSESVRYELRSQWRGRMEGGIETASTCVLKDVRNIQAKGASVIKQPRIRTI